MILTAEEFKIQRKDLSGKIIVCASGYFNPMHRGHIEYLQKARELGDTLVVIVNNDKQAILKKGSTFMKEDERSIIVDALKYVDYTIVAIDEDATVCESLKIIHPDIFAKGGDRNAGNVPEKQICNERNIMMIDGLGEKIQSSSNLLKGQP